MSDAGGVARLPAYLLARAMVEDRVILDLGPGGEKGAELLYEAGARLVIRSDALTPTPSATRRRQSTAAWLQLESDALPVGRAALDVLIAEAPKATLELTSLVREAARALPLGGLLVLAGIEPQQMGAARAQVSHLFAQVAVYGQHALHAEQLVEQGCVGHHEPLVLFDELAWLPGSAPHYVLFASSSELPQLERNALFTLPPSSPSNLEPQLRRLRAQIADLEEKLAEREREMLRVAGPAAHSKRLEHELTEARRALGLTEDGLTTAREQLASYDRELRRQRASVGGLERELEDAHREREDLRARALEAEQAATQVALELDRTSAERERIVGGQRDLNDSYEKLRVDYQQAVERIELQRLDENSATRRLERVELKVSDIREQLERAQEQHATLLVDRDRLREQLIAEQERQQDLALERARLQQQLDGAREDLAALKERLDKGRQGEQELAAAKADVSRLKKAEEVLQLELSELQQERREMMVALREQRRARIDLERDLERKDEGCTAQRRKDEERRVALEEQLERREQERAHLRQQLGELEEQLRLAETAQAELGSERAARQAVEEGRQRLAARLEEEGEEVARLQEELSRAQQQDRGHAQETEELALQIQARDGALEELQGRVEKLIAEREEQRATVFHLESTNAQLRRDLFVEGEGLEQLRRALEEQRGAGEAAGEEAAGARRELEELHEQQLAELTEQLTAQAAAYELEIDVRAHELTVAMTQLDQVQEDVWHSSDAASRHAARVAAAHASAENERQQHAELTQELETLKKERAELEGQLIAAKDQKDSAREGVDVRAKQLEGELKAARAELKKRDEVQRASQKELEVAKKAQREARAELEESKAVRKKALDEVVAELEQVRQAHQKADGELGRSRAAQAKLDAALERSKEARQRAEAQLKAAREAKQSALEQAKNEALAQRNKLEQKLMKAAREQVEAGKGPLQRRVEALDKELGEAKHELAAARKEAAEAEKRSPSGLQEKGQRGREKLIGERLDKIKQQRDEARGQVEATKKALEDKRKELSALYGKAAAQQEREKELKRIKTQLENAGLALTDELGRAKVMLDEMRQRVAQRDADLSAAKRHIESGGVSVISELEQKLLGASAEIEQLKSRLARSEASPGRSATGSQRVDTLNLKLLRVAREAARVSGLEQRIEAQRGEIESIKRNTMEEREEQEKVRGQIERELIVVERGRQRARVEAERAVARQRELEEMVVRLQEDMQDAGLITQVEPLPDAMGDDLDDGEIDETLESDEWRTVGEGRSGEGRPPSIPMARIKTIREAKRRGEGDED